MSEKSLTHDLVKEMYKLISITYDLSKSDKKLAFELLETLKPFRELVNKMAIKEIKEGYSRIYEQR